LVALPIFFSIWPFILWPFTIHSSPTLVAFQFFLNMAVHFVAMTIHSQHWWPFHFFFSTWPFICGFWPFILKIGGSKKNLVIVRNAFFFKILWIFYWYVHWLFQIS
jgi:hypothetical protein